MKQRPIPGNLIFLFLIFLNPGLMAQSTGPIKPFPSDSIQLYSPWVNQTFRKMSRKRRIEQLFMIAAYSNKSQKFNDSVGELIRKFQPGGIIFFQGGPVREARLTNQYQDLLKVKAMIAMDAEWGLGMRLDSTQSFPYQMTLGALAKDSLILAMGREIGAQLHRLGIEVNFAPVLDVNNNMLNSVINFRSFGENKVKVSEKANQYILGLQDMGILATGKHFPGHGDTEVDSHSDLPVLPFTRARLDSLELYPFRKAIALGIGGMMVAHMNIRAMDTALHLPSTLSGNVVNKVLKNELGFRGLVFTDAMNMKGVIKYYPTGEAETMAIEAGNDMVEMSNDLKKSIKGVRKAIRQGLIDREELNLRCRKVLAWKEWMGLSNYKPIVLENLYQDLNSKTGEELIQKLNADALTLLKFEDPLGQNGKDIFRGKGALISINRPANALFDDHLSHYLGDSIKVFNISKDLDSVKIDSVQKLLVKYDYLFLVLHDKRLRPGANLSLSPSVTRFISGIGQDPKAFITVMANPYTLSRIPGIEKAKHLVLLYQESKEMESSALDFWSGRLGSKGTLPVTIPGKFKAGSGMISRPLRSTGLN
jgi:beta-glucosidase-like glycosyl hydrolase